MLKKILNSFNEYPEKNVFFINDKYYTYSELRKLVLKVNHKLNNSLTSKNKLIGVVVFNDIETYASILGILFSGYGFVPINPAYPLERNYSIIEQSGIEFILSSKFDKYVEKLSSFKKLSLINSSKLQDANNDLKIPDVKDNDIAYLIFTSGSTGIPKGVQVSRLNLDLFIDAFFSQDYKLTPEDRCLQMFDLTFDLSIVSFFTPLCVGACVYVVPSGGIKYSQVYRILDDQQITFAMMVPSVITYLRPFFNEINLEHLRWSQFCGEPLYDDLVCEWSECVPNANIQNVYGPTESTIYCMIYNWKKDKEKSKKFNGIISIGKPLQGITSIIVDKNLKELGTGQKGELCISGKQITKGYWNNTEKNKESYFKIDEKKFYRTGDLAFIDEEGDFMFCGRIDNQVKVQGFRIELEEIEHYARKFTKLTNVAAIGIENRIGTTEINLFLENYSGDKDSILNYLKQNLPFYMIPSSVLIIPSFPLNQNGKIDRGKLKTMLK
ncbi:MAG TPA: amino acid adenylation domain-containing protein [Ignavibacteriaceae bacterium]|nr:amino acid adenylation domain-containing protein [Ignavibacteriaceae bacterium]